MPIAQGLAYYNQKFITLAEHYDNFIMAATMKNPNVWHDRIARGAYQNFSGLEQKSNIYRGGLPVQAGLSTWKSLSQSRKPTETDIGFDNCNPRTPQRYTYAWESVLYTGYEDSWQSEPICVNDLQMVDYATEQLGLIIKTGVDYGISMLENWNREMYVYQAAQASRTMVMSEGALEFEDNSAYRFTYNPFLTTTDVDGASVPYITFPANLKISTLNWDYLDYLRTSLADRAGEAAIGNDAGMPIFGLMIDLIDFEKYIKSNDELREDWRQAQPSMLIKGYSMGMKTYRGFALMHDPRQMRFRIKGVGTDGNVTATRVLPLKAGRAVTIGNVPEPNPDYFRAEIGIGVIFMNDVLMNLFVTPLSTLGSGTSFGASPGLTGDWKWINTQDNSTNILGESGYFFGRFKIFPKPLIHSFDATVFAYKRCTQTKALACDITTDASVGVGAIALAADAVAGDFDGTLNRVTVTLSKLLGVGVGEAVTVEKVGGTSFAGTVLSDALAPKYVIGWVEGATNQPTAYTDFTAAAATVSV
jgi:hypothetical protein